MKYDNITALRSSIVSNVSPEYESKMHHPIPDWPTVKNRANYLVEKSKDKVVLDIGCTGLISQAIRKSAKKYYGIDKEDGDNITGVDLNHLAHKMPTHEDVEVVICSEILEHISNPGMFLIALKAKYPKTTYFTVPNAGAYQVMNGMEIVNAEHVCWYSYQTLKTLLERYGYEIDHARWYNGEPYKAEGIIMVTK